jgi:rare lipoprotein A
MTAAHRQLPLGTKVMVENPDTGDQVEVKITDRGPYVDKKRRIIDLSKAAADSVGLVEAGVAPVRVVVTEEAAKHTKRPEEDVMYEVQVGAFEDQNQAQAVLEQVQDWFPKAYMAPRQGPEGAYYRVRVGPFTDKAAAQRSASGLTRGGHHVFLDEIPETALPPEAPPARPPGSNDHRLEPLTGFPAEHMGVRRMRHHRPWQPSSTYLYTGAGELDLVVRHEVHGWNGRKSPLVLGPTGGLVK